MITQEHLDELWNFDDPEQSAQRFAGAAANADPEDADEYRTQEARALGLQGLFDEASALLDHINAERASPAARARIVLERGRIANSAGCPEGAVPHFAEAVEIATDHGLDFLRIDGLHMLAIADTEREADWFAQAVRAAEAATDGRTQRWNVALHNNHGWNLFDGGDIDGAIAELELAQQWADRVGTEFQRQLAREGLDRARRAREDSQTS